MEPDLHADLCIKHAVAFDGLTEAEVEAAYKTVLPVATTAGAGAWQLLGLNDPFEAETQGASVVSQLLCTPVGDDRIGFAMLTALVARPGDAAASALLHVLEPLAPGPMREYPASAIERLEHAGVPCPRWEDDLQRPVEPLTAWSCSPVLESGGAPHSVMAFEFSRAGAPHGFLVYRDFRGDGSISKISAIPNIGWESLRKFLLAGEALDVPYAIEELGFDEALDHFDGPRMAMWNNLRRDRAHFAADPELGAVPGLTLLLEHHMTGRRPY
ncbi:hypothetical protein [Glycomyces tarimensis]